MCELCNGKGYGFNESKSVTMDYREDDEFNIFPDDESAGDRSKCRTGVAIKRQFMELKKDTRVSWCIMSVAV